ncbi:MAG: glycosyl transferase group 1 [Cyanobacteria bacterium RYN_339]|nr:glycosyl transferase group 1 [Cyanobacteria bacterium RYN_339]
MNLAIIHDGLATKGGAGGAERVLGVVHRMFPQAPIYTTVYHPGLMPAEMQGWDIRTSFVQRLPFGKEKYQWYLPLLPMAIEQLDLREFDVVVSMSHSVAKGVITRPDAYHMCYCYSPLRYAWDMYHEYLEIEDLPGWQRLLVPGLMHYLRNWDAAAASRVDRFVAISEYVRRRIEKYYRRPADVIYPPVDILKSSAPPADYYLVVSRLVAYKRLDLVIEAFNQLGWPLVVIGDGVERTRLQGMAKGNVTFLGRQPDAVVHEHLAACRGFVFPGIEDFGIAPVEAQGAGKPVIALNQGGAAETVVHGETGILFAKQTIADLVQALRDADATLFDPDRIRAHAERFSTERFEREFLAALHRRSAG